MIESICFFILMVTVPAYQPALKFEHLYFKISIFTKNQKSHLLLFKFEMKKCNIILKLCKEPHSLSRLFRVYIDKRVALNKFSHMCNWKNVKEHHSNITWNKENLRKNKICINTIMSRGKNICIYVLYGN